ncbi:hypothetical protein V5O48_015312, partial [Marasmius crinis-equi]
MSTVNAAELNLGNVNPSGNSVHTHGPFPILSFGASATNNFSPPTNDGLRFSGGENTVGNNFLNTPSMFNVPMNAISSSSSSSGGTWLANLKLAILTHKHADGTACSNVLEHAAIADSEEDPSFLAAHTKLIQHLISTEKERADKLEAENRYLRRENATLNSRRNEAPTQRDSRTYNTGNKRKPDSQDTPDRRPPPPQSSSRSNVPEPFPSPPSYNTLGSQAFPGRSTSTVLFQHAQFRPGFALSDCQVAWKEYGWLDIPDSMHDHADSNTLPDILAFEGEPSGSQVFPASPD